MCIPSWKTELLKSHNKNLTSFSQKFRKVNLPMAMDLRCFTLAILISPRLHRIYLSMIISTSHKTIPKRNKLRPKSKRFSKIIWNLSKKFNKLKERKSRKKDKNNLSRISKDKIFKNKKNKNIVNMFQSQFKQKPFSSKNEKNKTKNINNS